MHLNVALRPLILAAEEVLDLDYQLRQRTVHERGQERGVLLNQVRLLHACSSARSGQCSKHKLSL